METFLRSLTPQNKKVLGDFLTKTHGMVEGHL